MSFSSIFPLFNFNIFPPQNTDASSLSITAVTDDICLTISGHPIHLEAFTSTLPANITVHKTTLNTLYHSPSQLASVREQVLKDVKDRVIKFPEFSELIAPIRSTNTGELLDGGTASGLLVEAVVDMLLIQPVNWDRVVSSLAKVLPASSDIKLGDPSCIRLLNFGPGTGLMRSTEKSCRLSDGITVDLTFDATRVGGRKPKQEPIAIVGMAVNMPGAPNTTKLWEVLEKGINTCSEVRNF
jgi:Beta-ketoacyl synthase, N-terminal domain